VYEEDFAPFLAGVTQGLFDYVDHEEADLEVELDEHAKDLLDKEGPIAGRKVNVAAAEGEDEEEDGTIKDLELTELD
jgi:importin-4